MLVAAALFRYNAQTLVQGILRGCPKMAKGEQKIEGAHVRDKDERSKVPTNSQGIKGPLTDKANRVIFAAGDPLTSLGVPHLEIAK